MESSTKKRGRQRKSVSEDKTKKGSKRNKKAKAQGNTEPDNVPKKSPVMSAADLLHEEVPDDESLTIKIELTDTESIVPSENDPEEEQIDGVKSKRNSASSHTKEDKDNFEYSDTPYISRADMVLKLAPITVKEEETYADLYESALMDATNQYDWCSNVGDCLYYFNWHSLPEPPKPYEKRYRNFGEVHLKHPTLKDRVGPAKELTSYEAFTEIWNREVMDIIVSETNKNGHQNNSDWINTTIDELYVFFAITLAVSMDAKQDLNQFWQESKPTANISKAMTYKRFVALNISLSFCDVTADKSDLTEPQAKVSKIRPIETKLNYNFRALYKIGQDIVIDEPYHVCRRDGELIKMKKTYGIKEVNICDAETGYTTSFVLKTAKKDEILPRRGISPLLILKFMKAYKNKGYSIWCNNIFNSALLVRTAFVLRFNFVGTIGITENIDPKYTAVKKENLEVGEISGASCEDMDYILWRDKNLVSLVSTYHGKTTNEDTGRIAPAAFVDFKKNVASLDKRDQILADYVVETSDWVRGMFNRLLNISVYNSSILTKCSELTSESHREFRLNLIQELIIKHGPKEQLILPSVESLLPPQEPVILPVEFVSPLEPEILLSEPLLPHKEYVGENPMKRMILSANYWEHYPEEYGIVPGKKRQKIRKACVLCQNRSQTMCPACNVPLCLSSCHRLYHSMLSQ